MNLSSLLRIMFVSILALISIHGLYAQTKTVYGQVMDEQGEPLIGVMVRPDESRYTDYSTTDINGYFSITVPDDTPTLFVAYLGYKSQTVFITTGILQVVLIEENNHFNVHPGMPYFFPIRRDADSRKHTEGVTSAAASFPFPSYRIAADPIRGLEGVSPGLRTIPLTHSAPQAAQAFIRGIHSFSSASPLYVIDGVPMPADPSGLLLSHLNTADIAFLYVLRNPDETAFYGAQGGNGVILIYTRNADRHRGKAKVRFAARGQYTWKPDAEEAGTVQHVFSQQYTASFTTGTDSRRNRWSPHAHFSMDYLDAPSVVKGNELKRYSLLFNLDQQPSSLAEYGVGLNASNLEIGSRKTSHVFFLPYFRLRFHDYFALTSRGSMDQARSIAEYLPSYYPVERTMWTVSNLLTYRNNPVYYLTYNFKVLLTAGQEMQRVYGTTLHSFPLHADLEHSSVGKLSVNYRLEGYHTLGQTRWGSFGSVGYRLDLHNWFFSDNDYGLSLRTSYAAVGNLSPLVSDAWERTGKWNVGLDMDLSFKGFLNRLSFSTDYYRHTSRDLLLPGRERWDETLFGYQQTDADIRNQGMEFTLSMLFDHWRSSWKVDLTASRNTGRLSGYDTAQAGSLLPVDPWVGHYYDPDWSGSVIQTFSTHRKWEARLQCNYSLGDGRPLIAQQVLPATAGVTDRGNYFSIYSFNVTYHLKPKHWPEDTSNAGIFIEGNNLHTFGKRQTSYPDYIAGGRSIVAGVSWQF